jgi:glycosyltransferase involved in cell wall biosynthesis
VKITVVTAWYNEAFLAPFFLGHYRFANEILVIVDADTDDETVEICSRYPNVKIDYFRYPNLFNCLQQSENINKTVSGLKSDWVIYADADELIFPMGNRDGWREALGQADGNLLYAWMWQVYRHINDKDLDSSSPAIWQRRHGDPNRTRGINAMYRKPIIVKPEVGIEWVPGFHAYRKNLKIQVSETRFDGIHWQMADPDMAVQRRIKNQRDRQSKENLERRWAWQHHHITETDIRSECERHLHDPQLF